MTEEVRWPTARFPELSDAARAASLRAMMAVRPMADGVWVFAYGSLIWRPCFAFAERRPAVLAGYRRRFSVWTLLARGSPVAPGLALALEEDGDSACHGIAYRLAADDVVAGLEVLWAREMLTSVYHPRWVTVTVDGRGVEAISFVADKSDPQYAGALPRAEQAALIAAAHGEHGSCRDYLASTVAELERLGVVEPALTALLRDVDAVVAGEGSGPAPTPLHTGS